MDWLLAQGGAGAAATTPDLTNAPAWVNVAIGAALVISAYLLNPILNSVNDWRKGKAIAKTEDNTRADKLSEIVLANERAEKIQLLGELKETRTAKEDCEKHRARLEGRMSAIEETQKTLTDSFIAIQKDHSDCLERNRRYEQQLHALGLADKSRGQGI